MPEIKEDSAEVTKFFGFHREYFVFVNLPSDFVYDGECVAW
jgi:hypothetical protein